MQLCGRGVLGCVLVACCRCAYGAVQGDFGACVPFTFLYFSPSFLLRNLKEKKGGEKRESPLSASPKLSLIFINTSAVPSHSVGIMLWPDSSCL